MHDWKRSLQFLGALGELIVSPLALLALALRDRCARCISAMRKYAFAIFAVSNACAAFDFPRLTPMIQQSLEVL